jgi:hypothetical protein
MVEMKWTKENNLIYLRAYSKEYYKKNKEKLNKKRVENARLKREKDLFFKINLTTP